MHFYRPLGRIRAITFDLDDTLYDNYEVIRRTERESVNFLQQYHPALGDFQAEDFHRLRDELRAREPEIYHDATQWRLRTVEQVMLNAGLSATQAAAGAREAMADFARWRSRIEVTDETHRALSALAEHVPLAAITNGNAEPHRFGLDRYFRFILRAGPDGRAKPFEDMYHLAAEKLDLPVHQVLHVGDDLTADVAGAVRVGMQACWINLRAGNLMRIDDARLLPHIEISRLASLTALL
ncbi:5-amino-6-(5-phospho-D-ribitylamino)uracil phosphatase YigB [Brenneria izbisi]|uniref:5-amino-6-(5-phospho-D-ribitylamino)uracil phosphatase YigB n=1 Tax=Brenneria izbisi TaxID=2939450 RepID=A0AA41XY73_9GAMM|nr:5-amino-6-(5-phospho-D-ribitylamino)uracil phosphatase YigB [Brenneria izbisi]MCV9879360.1 5-amino-6-(5-phospho-D-ribitylamino)uracil phosphatase YigB [Brenneria izbisi]MCV9882560.1 5-amino-6-(5-phospho-D-ribitylamino)uracil phosphatase YigB [Brenneria izbisi]